MNRQTWTVVICLAVLLTLAACGTQKSGAVQAVENYLQAVVSQKGDQAVGFSCAAWEEDARMEADSFAAVTARIENLACSEAGADGDGTLVTCKGKIVATYNNEDQDFPLEGIIYRTVKESNTWLMCGYKQ
ncbi:MAG TPA: hypothetical protein PKW33_17465 [Anaerolineaceae bacterium]|nr:hypothetical protein [Anaerolineaceae bacterium]HPN53390.1 hypothetical protein [Anaerolineaceae bacterium]